ncbi:hypothetical protein [Caulobacter endophyticus]|uniref:hypothetical protein n=1 Tax=Caulobacter endophyticus TaxID=2172652 RepID=UPI0024105C76|nr:hypothetical protein [Caulobacter endophyticus]MDG2527279.1 hypothetical protein [Caulobacter endophyticus]
MVRKLLALLGLGLLGGGPALAAAPAEAPPEAWRRYAELAGRTFPAWLDEATPAAIRLRDYLDDLRAERGGEVVELSLSVWVGSDGLVSRVAAPVFAQPEPNADLQAVFEGRRLSEPPPPGLRLPIRLRLRVAPPAADAEPQATNVAASR